MIYKKVIRPSGHLRSGMQNIQTKNVVQSFHRMEMGMQRWVLGVTRPLDHIPKEPIRGRMAVGLIEKTWFDHVVRSDPNSVAHIALWLIVFGTQPNGRPKRRWADNLAADLKANRQATKDAHDRGLWRSRSRRADPPSLYGITSAA